MSTSTYHTSTEYTYVEVLTEAVDEIDMADRSWPAGHWWWSCTLTFDRPPSTFQLPASSDTGAAMHGMRGTGYQVHGSTGRVCTRYRVQGTVNSSHSSSGTREDVRTDAEKSEKPDSFVVVFSVSV